VHLVAYSLVPPQGARPKVTDYGVVPQGGFFFVFFLFFVDWGPRRVSDFSPRGPMACHGGRSIAFGGSTKNRSPVASVPGIATAFQRL
jgi:hypothetical protein